MLPRVLVADDDRTTAAIIAGALRDSFDVVVVSSGAAVLARAAAGDIDLVLLDVVMPDLDGFEVCRRLKDHPQSARIPVIFVTALEASADEAYGFSVGAVDYITKPIRPAVVRARVHTHVELKRARDVLEQLASADSLTGLANRRRFDAAIDQEWRRCQRGSHWLSLALVDVDYFKQFNDRYGHLAGDARLQTIATSLGQIAQRAGELAARYGGDEFVLMLPNVDPALMQGLMRTLLSSVSLVRTATASAAAHEITTASIGAISIVPPREAGHIATLAIADRLLYDAKALGRDCCVHQEQASGDTTVIHRASEGLAS